MRLTEVSQAWKDSAVPVDKWAAEYKRFLIDLTGVAPSKFRRGLGQAYLANSEKPMRTLTVDRFVTNPSVAGVTISYKGTEQGKFATEVEAAIKKGGWHLISTSNTAAVQDRSTTVMTFTTSLRRA